MTLNRDRIAALIFLALSITYLHHAGQIELYPGEAEDAFNAQTFPKFIGWLGALASLLMLILPTRTAAPPVHRPAFAWWPVISLCALMTAYGFALKPIGFFISTSLFLLIGFMILGERRRRILLLSSIPLAAGMQWILHGLLGIYIADPALQWLGIVATRG